MNIDFDKSSNFFLKTFLRTEVYILIATALTSVFGFIAHESVLVGVRLFVGLNLAVQPVLLYVYKDAILQAIRLR